MDDPARPFWNMAAETMADDQLRVLQVAKIRRQLAYCHDHSPFYREKFAQAGVLPEDVRGWEDFRRLPIMITPDEYKTQQERSSVQDGHPYGRILCAPLADVVGVASTSGTTGRPTLSTFTRRDIATTNEVLARAFWRMGIRPGDTVLHAFGLSMWVLGVSCVRALEAMGARPIAVGAEGGTERLLLFARLTRPTALLCTPVLRRVPDRTGAPGRHGGGRAGHQAHLLRRRAGCRPAGGAQEAGDRLGGQGLRLRRRPVGHLDHLVRP